MAGTLKPYELSRTFQTWKGLTKRNHLGAIFGQSPQKASQFMVRLLAYNYGKTLDTLISQFPTKEFESDDEYYWEVVGSSRRNIPLVEARDENGTAVTAETTGMIGAMTAPFYLVFAEDWFADGEVIVGNMNQIYPFRILGDARLEGTNYCYKVELMGGNTKGVPAERLLAGERFSQEFAPVERELSRKVGDLRFSAPITMRNEWTTLRKQYKVPGSALNMKLAVGCPGAICKDETSGKQVKGTENKWMHYVEWEFEKEWAEEKNRAIAFGTSNRNANGEYMNFGKSGEAIRMGSGLFEQMEVGNTMYYNHFSLKLIEDALYQLSAGKLGMNERTFVIKTGEMGAKLLHKAILDTVSGWTAFTINADALGMIQKTNSPLHQNALAAGFQFVEFRAPNGVKVKIEVDPYYDDPVRNKINHPLGGKAYSYRFDIMYIGTMDQPNIFKCKIKGQEELRGYQWGLRNPFTGQVSNMNMSYDEDSAVFHRMTTFGVCVLDPTRTMSIIPSILQG